MDYQKIVVKKYPKVPSKQSGEGKYWKRFKSPILIKEYASIPSIYFSPVAPHDFALASSTRVQIILPKHINPKRRSLNSRILPILPVSVMMGNYSLLVMLQVLFNYLMSTLGHFKNLP
ncbi:unnamed protein product [Absidia cylindrospora]